MVPVRKPGRPLSSCPHPASRPCTCSTVTAAVTAAIPKKQKCRCGTSDQASGSKAADKDKSNGLVTPPSPSSSKGTAAIPAYRIQKNSAKNGSGKSKIDPADLERMDASQLNILSSPEQKSSQSPPNGTTATTHTPPGSALPGYGMMGFLPNSGSYGGPGPAMFPLYQQMAYPNPVTEHTASKSTAPAHVSGQNTATTTGSSCCGGGKSTSTAKDGQHTPKANRAKTAESEPKSCCSSAVDELEPATREPQMGSHANSSMMMPSYNAPVNMPNGMYPYFAQPTVFTYPPQYGSYIQPLQPDQWKQLMMALNFGQQPMANMQNLPYSSPPVQFQQCAGPDAGSWTSHQCSCGNSCQCIGCATHPYNQATQDYVRSAWNNMLEDTPKRHKHSDSTLSASNNNNNYETPVLAAQSSNGDSTPTMAKVEDPLSPTLAQTPSDGNSSLGDEPTLSANDFFFVSYPFGDSCEGEMASCPCGDDCQCIGCAIHNNPALAVEQN